MPVYPEARALAVDQLLGVGNKAGVQERVRKARVEPLRRRRVMRDHHNGPDRTAPPACTLSTPAVEVKNPRLTLSRYSYSWTPGACVAS